MVAYFLRLAFWCIFWLLAWPIAALFKKKDEENCLTYALKRLEQEEGYLVIRWARSAKYPSLVWPHFLFLALEDNDKVQHLVPTKPTDKTSVPTIWFTGQVRVGDPEDDC